jgi:hypothetical protein
MCRANRQQTLGIKLTSTGLFDLRDHLFFPYLRPFLAGREKGEQGLLASAKTCFLRGS